MLPQIVRQVSRSELHDSATAKLTAIQQPDSQFQVFSWGRAEHSCSSLTHKDAQSTLAMQCEFTQNAAIH
eukprot:4781852-Pleurochrysis_carterae.AAC.1